MRGERLFRILGLVDEDLIEEAGTASSAAAYKRRAPWRRCVAAAACVTVMCGVGFAWLVTGGFRGMGSAAPGEAPSEGGSGVVHETEPLHVDGTTFMSYAGPVFPLATAEDTDLTAERTVIWDFAPGSYHDGSPRQWGASVTDCCLLSNPTAKDITATALYPFTGDFGELAERTPVITVDGTEIAPTLYAGAYAGGFRGVEPDDGTTWNLLQPDNWTDYQMLLADGGYLAQALGDYPTLDLPVTVYEFTDWQAPLDQYDAATQAVSFTIDQSRTTVLTYGFNGYSWDEATGRRQYSCFVPNNIRHEPEVKLLAILGDDIGYYTLQGYKNGDTSPGNELADVTCTVTRRETTLDAVLEKLCNAYLDWAVGYTDTAHADSMALLTPEMYRGAAAELLTQYGILSDGPMDRYNDGRLDEILGEVLSQDRVLYLAFPVTVPAGGSVEVSARLWKYPSFDFGCSGSENVGLQGYDLVTQLGSRLNITAQTAALVNTDGIEIVRQNLGFDLTAGVTEVPLDPTQEHYYLEIRPLDEIK